ncbi:Undecaprenyl-diphosphatase [uncultured archaeon]|nr:Undecaprenyl-diphosphatase [uncultured archaeon]
MVLVALTYFQSIILGIIQGITEWLPVSSKSMVIVAGRFLFGVPLDQGLFISIFLHMGSLVALIIYFWKDLVEVWNELFYGINGRHLFWFLFFASLVTGIIALPMLFLLKNILDAGDSYEPLFTMLIGVFLIIVAFLHKRRKVTGTDTTLTKKKGAIAGFFQGLSIIPGLSRSGLTISSLLEMDFPVKDALKLTFIMSIPVIIGAEMVLPLFHNSFQLNTPLLIGAIVAGVVGFFSVDYLLKVLENVNFFKATLILGIIVIILGASLAL